jgi:hypothetical protein
VQVQSRRHRGGTAVQVEPRNGCDSGGERRHHGGRLRLANEGALAAYSAERRGGAVALGQCKRVIAARSERARRGNRHVRALASSEQASTRARATWFRQCRSSCAGEPAQVLERQECERHRASSASVRAVACGSWRCGQLLSGRSRAGLWA